MSSSNWTDCMSTTYNTESYTERSPERQSLLKEMTELMGDRKLPAVLWAFLQVSDVRHMGYVHPSLALFSQTEGYERSARDAILYWCQREVPASEKIILRPPPPTAPEAEHSGTPVDEMEPQDPAKSPVQSVKRKRDESNRPRRRSPEVAKFCKERDNNLCLVSKLGAVEACHIYPWCAFGTKDLDRTNNFWLVLRVFWSKEQVDRWQQKIFRDGSEIGTESVANMMTLTRTLHAFHTNGAFALRPVRRSDDGSEIELEFHWLPKQHRIPKDTIDPLEQPKSSRGWTDPDERYQFSRYEHSKEPVLLFSGLKFTIRTEDPEQRPLPDYELLELQWHLQRVLAMSGASNWTSDDFHSQPPGSSDGLFAGGSRDQILQRWFGMPDREGSPLSQSSESTVFVDGL